MLYDPAGYVPEQFIRKIKQLDTETDVLVVAEFVFGRSFSSTVDAATEARYRANLARSARTYDQMFTSNRLV